MSLFLTRKRQFGVTMSLPASARNTNYSLRSYSGELQNRFRHNKTSKQHFVSNFDRKNPYRVLQKLSALKLSAKAKNFLRFQKVHFWELVTSVFSSPNTSCKNFRYLIRRKVRNDKPKFKCFILNFKILVIEFNVKYRKAVSHGNHPNRWPP